MEFAGEAGQTVSNMRSNTMKNGTHRVVGYGSSENGATGNLLYIDVRGKGNLDFSNVVLTTANAQAVRAVRGTVTGIYEAYKAKLNEANGTNYDLGGRKVENQKGVVITNGQKVIVK